MDIQQFERWMKLNVESYCKDVNENDRPEKFEDESPLSWTSDFVGWLEDEVI